MVILNIGGEGEVPGAINLNSFASLRRPLAEIARVGLVIGGDFTAMPIADDSVDEVVGNHLPVIGRMAEAMAREVLRVLVVGGRVRAFASSGGGALLLGPFTVAGLTGVTLRGRYAEAVKR